MAIEQRDIGSLGENTAPVVLVDTIRRGQVFTATHDGEGNPLSAIEKSFISFSWGGKNIEDFSLIVVNDGSRYNGGLYGEFADLTSDYDVVDGQNYWGTSFSATTKEFQLATDGMSERELQNFRNWFRPGIERELILAENPNRAISARVYSAPQYSLLPFEKTEEVVFFKGNQSQEKTYNVKSTTWKGTINLVFIFDEPFWYSKVSVFDKANENLTDNELRSIIEEGIPSKEMLATPCLLANNMIFDGTDISLNTNGINLSANERKNLYYCGTAKAKPIIKFKIRPYLLSGEYIALPLNGYVTNKNNFSALFVEGIEEKIQVFKFTTPGIFSAYNQVISIVQNDFSAGDSIIELKNAFRNSISNYYIRTWAVGLCDMALIPNNTLGLCNLNTTELSNSWKTNFITNMQKIFYGENDSASFACECTFDSATGEATMTVGIYTLNPNSYDFTNLPISPVRVSIEQNVGDMIRSNFITLETRTLPNENNYITALECLKVSFNCPVENFQIIYNYMYL